MPVNDYSAERSGAIFSTNPAYRAGWLCYINGVEVPIVGWRVDLAVWQIPRFTIQLHPDPAIIGLGDEDRVEVAIFVTDPHADPDNPDWRLLIDGEIVAEGAELRDDGRVMSFTCMSSITVFRNLYFYFMNSVDDILAAQAPEVTATGFATTGGLFYPHSLFHSGLRVHATDLATRTDNTPDSGAIQAPFELPFNVVRGIIDKDADPGNPTANPPTLPDAHRAIPEMNFFARHFRKVRFHNRWVRLPLLEDPENLTNRRGAFPIFNAARNDEALGAMQHQVAARVANTGSIWDMLQQTLGTVWMQVGMIPNPACVITNLDGKILRPLTDAEPTAPHRYQPGANAATPAATPAPTPPPISIRALYRQLYDHILGAARNAIAARQAQLRGTGGAAGGGASGAGENRNIRVLSTIVVGANPLVFGPLAAGIRGAQALFGSTPTNVRHELVEDAGLREIRDQGQEEGFNLSIAQYTLAVEQRVHSVEADGTNLDAGDVAAARAAATEEASHLRAQYGDRSPFDVVSAQRTQQAAIDTQAAIDRENGPQAAADARRPAVVGVNPREPVRLAQYFAQPEFRFGGVPHCNVAFPSMIKGVHFDADRDSQPTRLYVNDQLTMRALRAERGTNRELLLHALTVAYPEEADAILRHGRESSLSDAGGHVTHETGKNLLIGPEEVFRGPRPARMDMPTWFQVLMQTRHSVRNAARPVVPAGTPTTPATTPSRTPGGTPNSAAASPAPANPTPVVSASSLATAFAGNAQAVISREHGNVTSPYIATPSTSGGSRWLTIGGTGDGNHRLIRNTGLDPAGYDPPVSTSVWLDAPRADGASANVPRRGRARQTSGGTRMSLRMARLTYFFAQALRDTPLCAGLTDEQLTAAAFGFTWITYNESGLHDTIYNWNFGNYPQGTATRAIAGLAYNRWTVQNEGGRWTSFRSFHSPQDGVRALMSRIVEPGSDFYRAAEVLVGRRTFASLGTGLADVERRLVASDVAYLQGIRVRPDLFYLALGYFGYSERGVSELVNSQHVSRALAGAQVRIPDAVSVVRWLRQVYRENVTTPPPITTHPVLHAPDAQHIYDPANAGLIRTADPTGRSPVGSASAIGTASTPASQPAVTRDDRLTTVTRPYSSVAVPPGGDDPTEDQSFERLFKLYAQYEFLRQRYSVRNASVTYVGFNPYVTVGFPAMIFDSPLTALHLVGYVNAVSHWGSAQGGQAAWGTTSTLSYVRKFPEFLNDVRNDIHRFAERIISAPADPIDELRHVIQDPDNGETFYAQLFYGAPRESNGLGAVRPGRQPDGSLGALFRFDAAVGFVIDGVTVPIEITGENPATAEAIRRADAGRAAVPNTPSGGTPPVGAAAPGSTAQNEFETVIEQLTAAVRGAERTPVVVPFVPTPDDFLTGDAALRAAAQGQSPYTPAALERMRREQTAANADPTGVAADVAAITRLREQLRNDDFRGTVRDLVNRVVAAVRADQTARGNREAQNVSTVSQEIVARSAASVIATVEQRGAQLTRDTLGDHDVQAPPFRPGERPSTLPVGTTDASHTGTLTARHSIDDPNRPIGPLEDTLYRNCWDQFDAAMQTCARPACTLVQYIRFWHGGRTLNDLINEGIVEGEETDYAYGSVAVPEDRTSSSTSATENASRGATSRKPLTYWRRIYKYRQGPGTVRRTDGSQIPGELLDDERGYTSDPLGPSPGVAGLPGDYPQTRAPWDKILLDYRDRVRRIIPPAR